MAADHQESKCGNVGQPGCESGRRCFGCIICGRLSYHSNTDDLETSYYESILYQENEVISVNYMTDSEEEYGEYSPSNIYFSVEAP